MTTASTAIPVPFREYRVLHRLCVFLGAALVISGMRPESTFDWWLENAAAVIFIGILAGTYHKLPLSELSYALIAAFLILHEWGAHYKYSDVPLGEWMKPILGTERNHYDRVMHFGYGLLLAYPMQEWFMRSFGIWGGLRYFLPVQFTLACSAVYELLEAFMASILSPERGEEFVGMQGDIWDSQKDMALALAGALIAMAITAALRHWRPQSLPEKRGSLQMSAFSGK